MTEYYKQSFNNTVPELVKVSNWENDETKNEILVNVQEIAATTEAIAGNGETASSQLEMIASHADHIIQEMTILNPSVSRIHSAVGMREDADTANTVIGLLKSIVNKLS